MSNSAQKIEVLPARRELRDSGVTQPVGARAFDVLARLYVNAGRVVT